MKDNGVSVYEAYSCIYMRNTHIFVSVIILHDTDVIHEHASYKHIHVQPYSCTANPINMYMNMHIHVQPIPLGVTFSKAQSSKLERLFCHVAVKKDVRALSFEL